MRNWAEGPDWARDPESSADRANAFLKLQGVTNRLVADPARRTVMMGTLKAGTAYARVPEPGACAFCLMLGSRGAVYDHETVFGEVGRYHDNCRCLAIEVTGRAPLPQINQDLMAQVKVFDRELGRPADAKDWRQWVDASRQQAGQDTMWPRLKYVRLPRYKGDGLSTVFPGEKLPPLDNMPGHVLHGWRDKPKKDGSGWPHDESLADGHRWDTQRSGASTFPREWTDQQIVDAIREIVEEPTFFDSKRVSRTVWGHLDGVTIQAVYDVLPDGKVKFRTAYPVDRVPKSARKRG